MSAKDLLPPSILESKRPAVAIAPPGYILVARAEWDQLQAQLAEFRRQAAPMPKVHARIGMVLHLACLEFNCSQGMIRGASRTEFLTDVRCAIAHVLSGEQYRSHEIAAAIGRTSSSVRQLMRRTRRLLETDVNLRRMCEQLLLRCS